MDLEIFLVVLIKGHLESILIKMLFLKICYLRKIKEKVVQLVSSVNQIDLY